MSESTNEPPQPDPIDPAERDSSGLRPMHPALDTPPLRFEDGGRRPLDRVVFGVAAAVAVGIALASGASLGLVLGAPVRDSVQSVVRRRGRIR